jgi:hypothetical protein
MAVTESSTNQPFRPNFLRFSFKLKRGNTPPQSSTQPEISNYTHVSSIPRQAYNPAIYPLLAKPVARQENFVLLPIRTESSKRKRDPTSPVRVSIKAKGRESGMSEWNRYLSSYAEVDCICCFSLWLIVHQGQFNMTNPPEPPPHRPAGHLKAPVPPNDKERVNVYHQLCAH